MELMRKAYSFEISCNELQTTYFKKIDKLRDKKIKYVDLVSGVVGTRYTPNGNTIDESHTQNTYLTLIESGTTNKVIDNVSLNLFVPYGYYYTRERILINKTIDWEQSFINSTFAVKTEAPTNFYLYFVVWYEDENLFSDSTNDEIVKYYPLECVFRNGNMIDKMYFSENFTLKNAKNIINLKVGLNNKTALTNLNNAFGNSIGYNGFLNLSYKNDIFLYNVPLTLFLPQMFNWNMKEVIFSNMKFDVTESYVLIPQNLLQTSWADYGMFFNVGYIE
jgi:hypothetical protein